MSLLHPVRPEFVSAALESYPRLAEVINDLTENELTEALEVESGGRRRPSSINRMITRLVHLVAIRTREELENEYMHEPSDIMRANLDIEEKPAVEKKVKKRKSKPKVAKAKKKK